MNERKQRSTSHNIRWPFLSTLTFLRARLLYKLRNYKIIVLFSLCFQQIKKFSPYSLVSRVNSLLCSSFNTAPIRAVWADRARQTRRDELTKWSRRCERLNYLTQPWPSKIHSCGSRKFRIDQSTVCLHNASVRFRCIFYRIRLESVKIGTRHRKSSVLRTTDFNFVSIKIKMNTKQTKIVARIPHAPAPVRI